MTIQQKYTLTALVLLGVCVLSVAVAQSFQPVVITIVTDGMTATVETNGGDVGYPGPSDVTIERDILGIVVTSRTRLFIEPQRVWLPQVQK